MNLATRLKRIRKSLGLSQYALVKQAKLSNAHVCNIESGKNQDIKLSTAVVLARALGITLDRLAGVDPAHPEEQA